MRVIFQTLLLLTSTLNVDLIFYLVFVVNSYEILLISYFLKIGCIYLLFINMLSMQYNGVSMDFVFKPWALIGVRHQNIELILISEMKRANLKYWSSGNANICFISMYDSFVCNPMQIFTNAVTISKISKSRELSHFNSWRTRLHIDIEIHVLRDHIIKLANRANVSDQHSPGEIFCIEVRINFAYSLSVAKHIYSMYISHSIVDKINLSKWRNHLQNIII